MTGVQQRLVLAGAIVVAAIAIGHPASGAEATTETIVLLRHGEKPDAGLGQITCQGLNRALALPAVIARLFGRPDAIFAADPSQAKIDSGVAYDYVRPLATIEPTAVAFGLPVQAGIGLAEVDKLRAALERPAYAAATVVVAWEHHAIDQLAGDILAAHGGDRKQVPDWKGDDFDSLYIIRIVARAGTTRATFEHAHEGLDGQPKSCSR